MIARRWKLRHKIQSITPQKRRKNRFTITLESGDVFGISEDVFLSDPFEVGQYLKSDEIEKIQALESKHEIKNQALNLLSYRQRSRAELNRRLKEKGFEENDIKPILNEFESKGYINDTDFAKMYAAHLIEKKLLGPMAVKNEFYQHQIPDLILVPILDGLYEQNPPEELVLKIVEKRMKLREKSQKEKSRLVNLLKRKGFSWTEIEPVLSSINWDG